MLTLNQYAKKHTYKYSTITARMRNDKDFPKAIRYEQLPGLAKRGYYIEASLDKYFENRPIKEWAIQ